VSSGVKVAAANVRGGTSVGGARPDGIQEENNGVGLRWQLAEVSTSTPSSACAPRLWSRRRVLCWGTRDTTGGYNG